LREIRTANKEHPGSPILLFDLRQRVPGLNKEEVDDSILELAQSEGYQLIRHLYPGNLNKQELELMVPDGGNLFLPIGLVYGVCYVDKTDYCNKYLHCNHDNNDDYAKNENLRPNGARMPSVSV